LAALTVSTIVKTGGRRLAAASIGSSAFAVVVFVVALYIPVWLTVGLWVERPSPVRLALGSPSAVWD
jgi:hypothetical protein